MVPCRSNYSFALWCIAIEKNKIWEVKYANSKLHKGRHHKEGNVPFIFTFFLRMIHVFSFFLFVQWTGKNFHSTSLVHYVYINTQSISPLKDIFIVCKTNKYFQEHILKSIIQAMTLFGEPKIAKEWMLTNVIQFYTYSHIV